MANYFASFVQGQQAGREAQKYQQAQEDRNFFRQMAPDVIAGDPEAYAQVAARDPKMAESYNNAGNTLLRQVKGMVDYFDSAKKSNNPTAVQAAWKQISPFLGRITGQPVPDAYDEATEGPGLEQLKAQLAGLPPDTNGMPSGYREFQLSAQAAGLQPGTPEYEKAAKVALGLEGRASSAGFGFTKITGADGRERLARQNPRTGAAEVYNEATGDFEPMGGASPNAQPQTWAQPGATYQTPSGIVRIDPNIDPADLEAAQADIAGGAQSDNIRLPDRAAQQGRGSLFVSQTPSEKAYDTEAGKQRASLDFAAQTAQAEANAARLKKEAEASVTAAADNTERDRANQATYGIYESGMRGLYGGLSGATTGPVVGRLPAVTASQQVAEGGVAAMAPVLKQMFRAAGEGTFTDKDQTLLLAMLPTRTDLPAARDAKIANVDNIVRAKLGMPPPQQAKNPKTGEVLILRFGQWMSK